MDGKLAFGRPLVVRFVDEKESDIRTPHPVKVSSGTSFPTSHPSQITRNAKIIAIKNKLKAMEQEDNQENEKVKSKRMKIGE